MTTRALVTRALVTLLALVASTTLISALLALVASTGQPAREGLRKAAEQGEAEAPIALGDAYYNGEGAKQDYKQAISSYRKAAEQENPVAQGKLGLMYSSFKQLVRTIHSGEGLEQDFEKAIAWYESAADQVTDKQLTDFGLSKEGLRLLKRALRNTKAAQGDVKAQDALRKAAEQGEAEAQIALGDAYYNGEGAKKDYKQAVSWYRKAAEQGNPVAQKKLGLMYSSGEGLEQDFEKAIAWYESAAEQCVLYFLGPTMCFILFLEAGEKLSVDWRVAAGWVGVAKVVEYMSDQYDSIMWVRRCVGLSWWLSIPAFATWSWLCTKWRIRSDDQRRMKQTVLAKKEKKKEKEEAKQRKALAKETQEQTKRQKEESKARAEEQAEQVKVDRAAADGARKAKRRDVEAAKRTKEQEQAVAKAKKRREQERSVAAKQAKQDALERTQAKARQAGAAKRKDEEEKKREYEETMLVSTSAVEHAADSEADGVWIVGSLTVCIASVLGEGSGGTKVYKGKHADGRAMAVKVMKKGVVPVHRAKREMKLLQDLAESEGRGRQHVIQYRCIEEREDEVLLGMELCECSLHDVISVWGQRIPLEHQLRIVRQLCEAVAFLHEHQIVHRDVRPQNILFKQGGFEGTVKLTDFGLSKEVDSRNLDKSFTTTTAQAGTEIGSFGYYAPEVYRHGKQTAKVDVFSLGCCIFYVLSHGRKPFEDPNDPQNKYVLNANCLVGRYHLEPIQHCSLPEVVDLVVSMIDMESKVRPTMPQVLEHPLFWTDEQRFQFLCAVGKEGDVVTNSAAARAILPTDMPSMPMSWAS
jgi:TPR repeat protein